MGSVMVGIVLLIVVIFIIGTMSKDKKRGKSVSGCDGNCSHCRNGRR